MKKPLSLLLCLLTLLSCIGCESLVSNGNGTTEPTEITTAKQGENPFGEVLERLKENVSFSTRKDETRLYLLSDGEKTTLVEMLKGIVFLKIEKTEYKDKTSVAPRDKTQWIEIIFGNTEEESEACVLTVFSDGMIYATHGVSGTIEYFVSADVAVVYYSFNAYIAGLLVSDGYTDNRTEIKDETKDIPQHTIQTENTGAWVTFPPVPEMKPFGDLIQRKPNGTVSIYDAINTYCESVDVFDHHSPIIRHIRVIKGEMVLENKTAEYFKNIAFFEISAEKYALMENATNCVDGIEIFFINALSQCTVIIPPCGGVYIKISASGADNELYLEAESDFLNRDIVNEILYKNSHTVYVSTKHQSSFVSLYNHLCEPSTKISIQDNIVYQHITVTESDSMQKIRDTFKSVNFVLVDTQFSIMFELKHIATIYFNDYFKILIYDDGSLYAIYDPGTGYNNIKRYVAEPQTVNVEEFMSFIHNLK